MEFEIPRSEKQKTETNTNSRTRSFIFILRLPLAREFEGCPEIQAVVLRAACIRDGNSAGLLAWRHSAGPGLPAAVSRLSTKHRSSGARPTSSALQSRSGDGFTPSSRARSLAVIVAGKNSIAENQLSIPPETQTALAAEQIVYCDSAFVPAESPAISVSSPPRKITRGFPLAFISTSNSVSN